MCCVQQVINIVVVLVRINTGVVLVWINTGFGALLGKVLCSGK
jgi:hypothetical protein